MVTIIKKGASKAEIQKKIEGIFLRDTRRDIMVFAGKMPTIIDPLEFQKQLRNEWK